MRTKDVFLAAFVILVFILLFFVNVVIISMGDMKKNWAIYRCNPMFMPFASYFGQDPLENFTYCVQNTQASYMDTLLEPVNYSMSLMGDVAGGLMDDINSVRNKFGDLTGNLSTLFVSVFSVFVNIIIQFQNILVKLKDTFAKLVGTVITFAYVMEGGVMTGNSVMGGPIGGALKFVCFDPATRVHVLRQRNDVIEKLYISVADVEIGDVIIDGKHTSSTVSNVMKFECDENNEVYKIEGPNEDIYITGYHKMFHPNGKKWVYVRDYENAVKCDAVLPEYVYCFETHNGIISIDGYTFADWNDDNIKC